MKTCKTCNETKEDIYFIRTKINGKFYYNTKKCKQCKSKSGRINIKSLETRYIQDSIDISNKMSSECKTYLNKIKRRNGLINDIDFYIIAHYYIETFNYSETNYETPLQEILIMYKQLIEHSTII